MVRDEIDKMLRKGEGNSLEFKEASRGIPGSFFESVVSFSNREGGIILLGVNNEGDIVGIDASVLSKIKADIATALNDRKCINPPLYIVPSEISYPQGNILAYQIPVGSQVHDHAGRIFWREADADLDITGDKEKVGALFIQKRNFYSETKVYPYLTINDLDDNLFDKARSIIRGAQPFHPWANAEAIQILRESSLHRVDYQSGETGLTLAAALIFGKDQTIQSLLPAYKIEALVRKTNIDRYDDRLTLRTNLIDSYILLMDFIKKHLDAKFFQEGIQRQDLRELIFREIIGNIIVHREYTSSLSTELIIYSDRVVTTNPNNPFFRGPIDPLQFNPHPKNPNIRKFFNAFGWTDEIGSGIRNTTKFLKHYTPGAKPLFIEDDIFKTEIPLIRVTLIDYLDDLTAWFELPAESREHLSKSLIEIAIEPELANRSWSDLILELVPRWQQKSTMTPVVDWPKKQNVTKEEIKKVPGWSQKSTMLIHKKSRYILSILMLSSEPIKLESLMNYLNYSNRSTFRKNYLQPLQKAGWLRMTNPDNPRDPEQKYVTTESGKLFLSGRNN